MKALKREWQKLSSDSKDKFIIEGAIMFLLFAAKAGLMLGGL